MVGLLSCQSTAANCCLHIIDILYVNMMATPEDLCCHCSRCHCYSLEYHAQMFCFQVCYCQFQYIIHGLAYQIDLCHWIFVWSKLPPTECNGIETDTIFFMEIFRNFLWLLCKFLCCGREQFSVFYYQYLAFCSWSIGCKYMFGWHVCSVSVVYTNK